MDWVRGEGLGYGSFARVNLAVSKSPLLPPLMAVKSCGVSLSPSLMNERSILEELKGCPEIINCFGESVSYENGEKLYNVLLEYAPGGSLADKLKVSGDQRLPESQVRQYTKALLRGLHYIHKFGYVHCDIKLQNILLCADGSVKIADFGLAKQAGSKGGFGLRGTPMYMSPEIVAGIEQEAPADIWALGCVMSEMITGSPPWSCSDVAALLMTIAVGEAVPEIPGILSDNGKDFLRKCLVKDPGERWTAEMLLNHPFLCDQDFATMKGVEENTASTSPRCPFDFQEWGSPITCSITSLPLPAQYSLWFAEESSMRQSSLSISPAERLLELVTKQDPNWSVSDDWVTVR